MTQAVDALEKLLDIMTTLRAPDGCPWDREQTLETLKASLIEETYEVVDAIDLGDPRALKEELGDLLLQIVFQSEISRENNEFTFNDVAQGICDKLIRRHPHVFADVDVSGTVDVLRNWEKIKQTEKGDTKRSVLDGVPASMPALLRADQVQQKAARVGFDWDQVSDVFKKVEEELFEVKIELDAKNPDALREELGDLLFSVVNLCRFSGHNAEESMDLAIKKFTRRFQAVENKVHAKNQQVSDYSLEELDKLWDLVKKGENKALI